MQSIGCLDYGNNNFFEVMRDEEGTIFFEPHDGGPPGETVLNLDEFFGELPNHHIVHVVEQLILLCSSGEHMAARG